jgi:PAS domain-containing protein
MRIELEHHRCVSLVEHSPDFIGMCDVSFKPVLRNDAGLRLVGLDNLSQALETEVKAYHFRDDREFMYEPFLPQILREGHSEMAMR